MMKNLYMYKVEVEQSVFGIRAELICAKVLHKTHKHFAIYQLVIAVLDIDNEHN